MSWHRFPIMRYDDTDTFRCVGPRKSALKKSYREFINCRKKTNNNIFRPFTKCNEYKKTCTFKPCEHSPVLHSTVEQPPSCFGDKRKNKRINTDYVCLPESDNRTTKKRTRFTEASGLRSPCSILSLQSKNCQGSPYVIHCPKHRGVCELNCGVCEHNRGVCEQNEAEVPSGYARCCENRRRNVSTDFCQPTFNDYNPRLATCADDLPCILDTVHRKCRIPKSRKKVKNKKTGGDTCLCYVDATTSTNGKSRFLKTIKPRRRDCSWNPKSCAGCDDSCCKYYKDEGTITKDNSCCPKGRTRIVESQTSDCCHNTCPEPVIDEAIGTNDVTGCYKILKPRLPGCHTVIPECQKLTAIISEYQLSECNKICENPPECLVDDAVDTNDKYGCTEEVSRIPICQIPKPEITHCQNYERREIRNCTDHCEYYNDSATDTLKKSGCFKVIRPKLRECSRPKWYNKLKNRPCVGSDFFKDASTITKYKSRCWRSKVIRPRIHGCQYSKWNCFSKSKSCMCCLDNAEICKCQQFNWKKIFRRKTKVCTADVVTCERIPECQIIRKPCVRYVNVGDECGRPVSSLCDVSAQCVETLCDNPLTRAREIMIKSTAICSSNKCDNIDFPCGEVYREHPNSHHICVKCCKPSVTRKCVRCRLYNCFEHLMMGTAALCCCPCFLVALSYWFACYLLTKNCKKPDETFRTPDCRDVLVVQGENCNRIKKKCHDTCIQYCINDDQNCIFNAPPGYTVEMYSNKATDTACLRNSRTLTRDEEKNDCNKKNKIQISKRCKKKSCPNPQRKYNLYFVDDRGWVIKPISDGACGGGDNNLNLNTCCDKTDPKLCSTKITHNCEKLNYEDPCCKSNKGHDPCENSAEPESVIYSEQANYNDACCTKPDHKPPRQNSFFCDRLKFQDTCACYYCTTCRDRTICCSKPWRPNNDCICISDCQCPKPSFWKWMFCKFKTGVKCHQSHWGSNKQTTDIGFSSQKAKMRSSYEKPKIRIDYKKTEKRAMRKEQNSRLRKRDNRSISNTSGRVYYKSKIRQARSNVLQKKMGRTYQRSKTRFRKFCIKLDHFDKKFRSESEKACRDMIKDIVQLRPSMRQTFSQFSRSVFRLFRFILVSCFCCPVFCCFYCCNICCYRMYCNVMC